MTVTPIRPTAAAAAADAATATAAAGGGGGGGSVIPALLRLLLGGVSDLFWLGREAVHLGIPFWSHCPSSHLCLCQGLENQFRM